MNAHGARSGGLHANTTMPSLTPEQLATLTALADCIIPGDDLDAGASAVNAAPRLAEKIATGVNAPLYEKGLDLAQLLSTERHNAAISHLTPGQLYDLLVALRDALPAFFKQLRMDVSALYLSDPNVWRRIGFPGPSTANGGHPDFAEPQATTLKQVAPGQRPADAPQDKR
jgi:hypothetical protein